VKEILKKYLGNKYLVLVSRLALGFIFVYASTDKIAHPGEFAEMINNYRILPLFTVNIVAIILPWIELLCGLLLISGIFTRSSALLISGLLVVFTAAMLASVLRGLDISCGCFSVTAESSKVGLKRLIEDIVMLVMSMQIFVFANPFATLESFFSKQGSR